MDIFNIKAINPNAKTTHTTFSKIGKPTKVKHLVLVANPVLCLKSFPGLQAHTDATAEQMKVIASKSRDELLKLKAEFDKKTALAFKEKQKTKTVNPKEHITEEQNK